MTARVVGALALEKVQHGTRTVSAIRWVILNARGEEAAFCQTQAAAESILAGLRALMAQAEADRSECERLRAAMAGLLATDSSGSNDADRVQAVAHARAALAECVASRPAGELGGGK